MTKAQSKVHLASQWRLMWWKFKRHRMALVSGFFLAVAYASIVRDNRVLSTAAAYLHGVCVAALVQAIAFVTLVLVSQQSQRTTIVEVGPLFIASVIRPVPYLFGDLPALVRAQELAESLPAVILLLLLMAILALAMAGPRWLRRSIQ